ncbi:MAG: M3 family metallopeptidase [Kofleriaceae bacterium]
MKRWTGHLAALALLGAGCAHPQAAAPSNTEPQLAAAPAAAPPPAPRALAPAVYPPFAQLAAVDVPDLQFEFTPAQLDQACAAVENTVDAQLAAIVAIPDGQRTFANTFDATEQALAEYEDASGRLAFLKEIHPVAEVRAAAARCEERAGKHGVELGARKDLYLAMKGYLDHAGKTEPLDAIDHRLIMLAMRDFRRNGLELSDADRTKLIQLRSRLAELQTQYSANLDNDTTSIEVTRGELAGLPAAFVARLTKAPGGKLVVTTKYPDYYPVMENARLEALRKREYLAFNSREADKNLPLLAEAVKLRDEAAHLLGYKTHADYVTETRMAKNAAAVATFLTRLQDELRPGRDVLDAKMLALKQAETHDPHAKLQAWDWRYFMHQIRKRDYALDDEQIRAYFPADKVMAGMFQVYSTILHVTFTEVKDAKTWADGVKLYEVHDAPGGKLLAKFYVDLFPRPGKYGHAASFPIGLAREVKGGYQIPLSALVVNFNPPEHGKRAHLSIDEVEVLFHEFGHIMHGSLTTARYASMAGTNVDTDFVEAPSQMMENFVYQPSVLELITEDPAHPGHTMPKDLIDRIARARTYDAGVRYTRQVFLASFDEYIHTHGDHVDLDAVDHDLRASITGLQVDPHEHFAASFGHMMGGYDAGYYGYLWSKVFADDIFTRFEQAGVLDPKIGREYRDDVLAPGREQAPDALLAKFLGRSPDEHAFLRLLGIATPSTRPAK